MVVKRAPYINYNELDSNPLLTGDGAEIPIFIGTSSNEVESVSRDNIYYCRNIEEVESIIGNTGNLYSNLERFCEENQLRLLNGETDTAVPYFYVFDLGDNDSISDYRKALKESKVKREATAIVFTDTANVSDNDLVWQEFTETEGGQSVTKYKLVNYSEIVFSPLYYSTLTAQEKTIIDNALGGVKLTSAEQTTFIQKFNAEAKNKLITFANVIKNELKEEAHQSLLRIAYFGIPTQSQSETEFSQFVQRVEDITSTIKYPRIGFIELVHTDDLGLTVARICSTPYYIEPGYSKYYSVETTQYKYFKERTPEERDALFNAGLIFNEYDYTLEEITPRICLAVSSAWGVKQTLTDGIYDSADYGKRVNDALLHARRNVDEQIRKLFKIIAPQLKRNETSVNLMQLQTELNICLEEEEDNGRIQEYEINIEELTMNPYCLKISGRIVPVNSTLAIEFENYVGAPYAIATDYI